MTCVYERDAFHLPTESTDVVTLNMDEDSKMRNYRARVLPIAALAAAIFLDGTTPNLKTMRHQQMQPTHSYYVKFQPIEGEPWPEPGDDGREPSSQDGDAPAGTDENQTPDMSKIKDLFS